MKLITEEWLSRAKDDLDVAKEILVGNAPWHCREGSGP
jgi:HEPN domain-containing protein